MLTMYICATLSLMLGSAVSSSPYFRAFLEVRRHVEFRRQFPDHPMTLMQSDELVGAEYAKKKAQAVNRLQTVGMLVVWPFTIPWMLGSLAADKVINMNDKMAPKITIDYNKIREEEGR